MKNKYYNYNIKCHCGKYNKYNDFDILCNYV